MQKELCYFYHNTSACDKCPKQNCNGRETREVAPVISDNLIDPAELVPFRVSQSLKYAKTTFSTLSQKLPVRMKGPLIVTTELFGEKSVQILQPIDPSYNLLK